MHANTIYKETKTIAALAVAILMIVTAAAVASSLESDAATTYTVTVNTEQISGPQSNEYNVAEGGSVYVDANGILHAGVTKIHPPKLPDPTEEFTYEFSGWKYVDSEGETVEVPVSPDKITVNSNLTIFGEIDEITKQYAVTAASSNNEYGTVEWYDSEGTPINGISVNVDYNSAIYTEGNTLYAGDYYAVADPAAMTIEYAYAFDSWDLEEGVYQVTEALTVTASFVMGPVEIVYNGVVYELLSLQGDVNAIGFIPEVQSINIPDSFYYDDYDIVCTPISVSEEAFIECEIVDEVFIGANVTEIGYHAFAAPCFKSIDVSDDNEAFASDSGVLYTKDKAVLIQFPASKQRLNIPETVKEIASGAFQNAGAALKSEDISSNYFRYVLIPANVETIGADAFSGSTLECLKFSGCDVSIGDSAFANCSGLNYIVFNAVFDEIGDNIFEGCAFYDENGAAMALNDAMAGHKFTGKEPYHLDLYIPPVTGTIVDGDVKYRITANEESMTVTAVCLAKDDVTELVIPDSITYLGFEWTVTGIASKAFAGNSTITSVESAVNVGYRSFSDCPNLAKVKLSSAVNSIGSYAFCNCKSLTTVENNVLSIGESAFSGCNALYDINLTEATSIAKHAFFNCKELQFVQMTNIKTIGYGAFTGTNLTEVIFGDDLSSVDSKAFYGYTFKDVSGNKIKANAENLSGNEFSGDGKVLTMKS